MHIISPKDKFLKRKLLLQLNCARFLRNPPHRSIITTSLKLREKRKNVGANTIVINGKHYDAKTGRLVSVASKANHSKKPAPIKQNGTALDGFSRRTSSPVPTAHTVHAKTEKSKTLRRDAVRKPSVPKVHAKTTPAHKTSPHTQASRQHGATAKDHERAERAATVPKSSLISRFGASVPLHKPTHKTIAHVPVAQAPSITTHSAPPISVPLGLPNPFDNALQNATSHEQPLRNHKTSKRHKIAKALRISPRGVSLGSFVLAGLLLGGFFVYQNIPNLAMRVAAARSGVSAALPGYKPGGFAMAGPITYSPGKISISYRSTTDERAYQVTQSRSEWDNETLLDKFVSADRRIYQTYQDKGKTIYIYNGSNATWVDNGVWYQVEGASSLNSDQLLRIANSL